MDLGSIIIQTLNSLGFFNVILPFILVYALVYGILARSKIFGDPIPQGNPPTKAEEDRARMVRSIISLVSLSVAFLFVGSVNVVASMKEVLPYIVLYIIVLFMMIMSLSVFYLPTGSGNIDDNEYKKLRKILGIVAIGVFSILVMYSFGLFSFLSSPAASNILSSLSQYSNFAIAILTLFLMIGIAYWATKPPSKSEGKQESKEGEKK